MKRLVSISLAAFLMVVVSSSAQDDKAKKETKTETPAAAATSHPYYPLKQNQFWVYKTQGGPIKVKVVGTEKIKDTNCFKLETSAGGKSSATESVGITKDGAVARFQVNGLNPQDPIVFLTADAKKGSSWEINTKVQGQTIKGTYKVTEEKIKVNEKEYETLHVTGADMEIGNTKSTVEYWFAKDVGIVKLKFSIGSQDATLELESTGFDK